MGRGAVAILGPKKSRFQGPPFPVVLEIDFAHGGGSGTKCIYFEPLTGREAPHLYCVLYGIISKRHGVPPNCSLEKNQVLRELALIAIPLACLVAQ